MDNVYNMLAQSVGTGEVLTIAYAGGSRPGAARGLVVVKCSTTDFVGYEPGIGIRKHYKVDRVLWVENSSGERAGSGDAQEAFEVAVHMPKSLEECVSRYQAELEQAGWVVHNEPDLFGVGGRFKNGNAKKSPSIAIRYIDRSIVEYWDTEKGELVQETHEPTGRERPWRVDSWRLSEGRAFSRLASAIELFLLEVMESDPACAKGMFAGH